MRSLRFYLETSFWVRLEDKMQHLKRAWTYDFLSHSADRHEIFISGLVLDEIERGPADDFHKIRRKMRRDRAKVLPGVTWAERFAEELRMLGDFTPSRIDDLRHVGYAVGGAVDALVTWDVNTLACDPVRKACARACRRQGRRAPLIGTPLEVAAWLGLRFPRGIRP